MYVNISWTYIFFDVFSCREKKVTRVFFSLCFMINYYLNVAGLWDSIRVESPDCCGKELAFFYVRWTIVVFEKEKRKFENGPWKKLSWKIEIAIDASLLDPEADDFFFYEHFSRHIFVLLFPHFETNTEMSFPACETDRSRNYQEKISVIYWIVEKKWIDSEICSRRWWR